MAAPSATSSSRLGSRAYSRPRNAEHRKEPAETRRCRTDLGEPDAGGKVGTPPRLSLRFAAHVQSRNVVADGFEQGACLRGVDTLGTPAARGQ